MPSAGYLSAGNSADESRRLFVGSMAQHDSHESTPWVALPAVRAAFFETQKSKSVLYASPRGVYRAVDLVAFVRREVAAPEYANGQGYAYRAEVRADGGTFRVDLERLFRLRRSCVGKPFEGPAAVYPPPCLAHEFPGLLLDAQFQANTSPEDVTDEAEADEQGSASSERERAPRRYRGARIRGRPRRPAGGGSDGGSVDDNVDGLRTDISEVSTFSGRRSREQGSVYGDSRSKTARLPKLDPRLIKTYVGQNEEGRPEEYQLRPRTWVKEAWSKLISHDVPEQFLVRSGLDFCSHEIRTRYQNERMKPYAAGGDWLPWLTPATPSSLVWANFARWLCEVYGKHDTGWWEQVIAFSKMRQGPHQTVREFITEFERQRYLLHDLRTLYDDVFEQDCGTNPPIWPPPIRESRWDRDLFCAALRPEIGQPLLHVSVQTAASKGYSEDAVARYAPDVLSRRRQSGYFEIRLCELQEIAESIEAAVAKHARTRGEPSRYVRQPFKEREPLAAPAPGRTPLKRLMNSHSVEELDDDNEDRLPQVEHLFQRLQREHKVRWSRAQLKILFDKNLCFNCAQSGHKSPECPNRAVNPSTIKFKHMVEIDSYEDDDDLYQALHAAFVVGNEEASLA